MHSNVTAWTVIKETRGFEFCSTPARDQDSIYRPILDDYIRKNKETVFLERKFQLVNYVLAGPEEWKRSMNRKAIAAFSVVGFNPERTRAAVCFWADHSGTCPVLLKTGGTWQFDKGWRGDGCGWAY